MSSDDDAMARIHALCVALEYLGVCGYSYTSNTTLKDNGRAGYLHELETKRRNTHSLRGHEGASGNGHDAYREEQQLPSLTAQPWKRGG